MKRILSSILALLFLLTLISAPIPASAGGVKDEVHRTIAVVFDNSGSMYGTTRGGTPAGLDVWCKATYALEVFASMMNPGDTFMVYPMHDIELGIGGPSYSMDNPLIIRDPQDAHNIREIYTPEPGGTPIETITKAYEGLSRADGEKWLIVLTDGATFYKNGTALDEEDTFSELSTMLEGYSSGANVLYLGIGDIDKAPNFNGVAEVAKDSNQILEKLTGMCNMIFGRDTLDDVGSSAKFGVSMKKLIVFAQGTDLSDVSITKADGSPVGNKAGNDIRTSYALHPSDARLLSGGSTIQVTGVVDNKLQGMIVTYTDCLAGEYSVNTSGHADSISIYYEPDVDLVAELIGPDGNPVDPNKPLEPGEYTIRYGLKDNQTGEMTSDKLLGKAIYDVSCNISGVQSTDHSENMSDETKFELGVGDSIDDLTITAQYLSGYRITKSNKELGLPWPFAPVPPTPAGSFEVVFSDGQEPYHLSELSKETPYTAQLIYNGKALSGDELASAQFDVADTNGIKFRPEIEGDHYVIYMDYADPAHPESVDCGAISAAVTASYTEPDHEPAVAETQLVINIENDVTGLRAELKPTAKRITMSEIESKPIYVDLLMGGEPLTDKEMNDASWDIVIADGAKTIPFDVEKDPVNSRLVINLKGDGAAKGNYTVKATVTTRDKVGQETSSSAVTKIKLRTMALWLIYLIIFAILAALAALITFIMTRKILPKRVFIDATSFMVDGEEIPGDATVSFNDGGQKSGHITINSPRHPTNPLANCRVTLNVVANDTRWKAMLGRKAGRLTAKQTGINTSTGVTGVSIAGITARWDEEHHPITNPSDDGNPYEAILASPENMSVNAEVMNEYGGSASVSMSCTMRFQ